MAGQSIPLKSDATSIGRGDDNDIVIDDATVSRRHALISADEGRYFVEDNGSSTGTLVEGAAATRTLLASGATVQIGGTEAIFVQGETTNGLGAETTHMASQDPAETMMLELPSSVMAWVAVTEGAEKGKTFQLKIGDNTIGRDPENDLMIEDSSVSRRHAMIRVTDDGFLLVDMGSRGGTRVAGKNLGGMAIKDSGVIEVGQTRLSLVPVERAASPSAPAFTAGETIVEEPGGNGGGVLIAQAGPDAGQTFPLGPGDNVIGRDPGCNVLLSDDAASRRHAIIRREQNGFVVYDLGSWTGTKVNGKTVGGHRLSPGELISLGNAEIVLMKPTPTEG
jgi:pSer/pThr/pTyr-binding forkhead associated (FHA) protein